MTYFGEIYGKLWDKHISLDKRAEQVDEMVSALKDIQNWNDDLQDKWGDPKERAKHALSQYDKTAAEWLAQ